MNFFNVEITSPEEEDQYVAKFLKILGSLGEHASSLLFQKGVVLGDRSFIDYSRKLNDGKFRDSVIGSLLRPGDKESDQDMLCLVAVLLFNLSKEATQTFLEIQARPGKTGASSGVINLAQLMALIDRATAFLNLPSVNDKSYWRLMTLQPQAAPPAPQPAKAPPTDVHTPAARSPMPSQRVAPAAAAPQPSPMQNPKRHSKPKAEHAPPPDARDQLPKHAKTAEKKKPAAAEAQAAEQANDSNKPEGPIKAMLRRIADEIHDTSYEAILEALKDETLMKDLYNTSNNPITVRVTEINAKERLVYVIKQKLGDPEPVTFRLIRKLVTELQ